MKSILTLLVLTFSAGSMVALPCWQDNGQTETQQEETQAEKESEPVRADKALVRKVAELRRDFLDRRARIRRSRKLAEARKDEATLKRIDRLEKRNETDYQNKLAALEKRHGKEAVADAQSRVLAAEERVRQKRAKRREGGTTTKPAPKTEPKTQPQAEDKSETKPTPNPETEPAPAPKTEPKTQPQAEDKPETKPDSDQESDQGQVEEKEDKPEPDPDPNPEAERKQDKAGEKESEEKDKDQEDGDWVVICHRPPGNPKAAKTMRIPRSALKAHLDHGDTLGPCEESEESDSKGSGKGKDQDKGQGKGNSKGGDKGKGKGKGGQ
ncbi:MAG: hypothetical protein DWQ01_08925 [Planctomycetota bacterium]|nr:MAG: hypothetical protein DWQ01_08925 [Planctomycetota bacterium]